MADDAWIDQGLDPIPPFPRKPADGTVEAGQFWLARIDAKLHKLEVLGLRPHATLLEHRAVMERWARDERASEMFPRGMQRHGLF